MNKSKNDTSCPCGAARAFADCCQPYLNKAKPAPNAKALMRSRYSAYAMRDEQYLLDSWHKSTRPEMLDLAQDAQWIRLKILASSEDLVEFVATYRVNGKAHKMQENSRFVREGERWYYLDGEP